MHALTSSIWGGAIDDVMKRGVGVVKMGMGVSGRGDDIIRGRGSDVMVWSAKYIWEQNVSQDQRSTPTIGGKLFPR